MSNFVGDLAFPDNPNRRKRAGELHDDIVAFGANFQNLYNERAQVVARLKPKVDALLQKFDIATPDKLNAKLSAALNSEQMQKYQQLKQSLDTSDQFQNILSAVVDIGAVSSGIVLTGLAIVGVITGGAAFAAAGEILAVLAAIVAIVGLFEGSEERDKLRQAIGDLFPKRQEVRRALGQMTVVVNWIQTIEIWIDQLSASQSATVDVLAKGTVKEEYDQWTEDYTRKALSELDTSRGSWTNEDPGHDIPADFGSVLPIINPFKPIEDLNLGSLLGGFVF